jgi:ribosomal protein L37AE/L43A
MLNSEYDLGTVVNRNQFTETVELKECELVGRSLVARRPLSCGDTVLVETPLLQYYLEPNCRSSLSPFYSKKLWKHIKDIVNSEDPSIEQHTELQQQHPSPAHSDSSDYDNDSDYDSDYDNDSDDDDSDDESATPTSSFIPGVPAAMLAYLQIDPPPSAPVSQSSHFKRAEPTSFDFFYHPALDMDHDTVRLVYQAAKRVVSELDVYHHVDPEELCRFVLKIYGNAHTVALDRKANARSKVTLTHSKKHRRRQTVYAHRRHQDEEQGGSWASSPSGPRPSIALMLWGSKFAHACSPNLLLQYDPPSNTMMFVATRDIAQGSVLTFSYLPEDESLGGLVCGTTQGRRAKLQQFKFFDCACDRCQARDLCRGDAPCPDCGNSTWYQGSTRTWTCDACHATGVPLFVRPEMAKGEAHVERMVTALATKVRTDPSVVHMMETYLNNLIQQHDDDDTPAIPHHHWTYGYIQGLLAIYHLDLFPRTFGKGLASQLGLTETGLNEARWYLLDFLHEQLWASNPVPVFFAAWHVVAPLMAVVMEGTEEKQYLIPVKKAKPDHTSDDDSDDSDDDAPPVMLDPLVVALPDAWASPVCDIVEIVAGQWIPVIKQIFAARESVVVDDMVQRIERWHQRVEKAKGLV